MSEREGNTGAQRVEEREVRSGHTSGLASLEEERGTSWVSVVLGWLAALGGGLILSGIVSGIVGAIFGTAGSEGITEGGATALIGLLITLLLALAVTLVLAIVGGLLGVSFIDQLSGITLPEGAQQSAQQATPQQGLGTILSVSGLLALLFPFLGGAIGGLWGARIGTRRP